jgi:hypothetical protein
MNWLNFIHKIFQHLIRFFTWACNRVQAEIDAREASAKAAEVKRAQANYLANYWIIALVLFEIARSRSSYLKIFPPSEPKSLVSQGYAPKNPNEFCFDIQRARENAAGSDNAVPKHVICDNLERDFQLCGFKNFKIQCSEDTYFYHIYFTKLDDFKRGTPVSTNCGTLSIHIFNSARPFEPDPRTGFPANFVVNYFRGGNSGGLRDGTRLTLYYGGQFYNATTARDSFFNPFLLGKPSGLPDNSFIVFLN